MTRRRVSSSSDEEGPGLARASNKERGKDKGKDKGKGKTGRPSQLRNNNTNTNTDTSDESESLSSANEGAQGTGVSFADTLSVQVASSVSFVVHGVVAARVVDEPTLVRLCQRLAGIQSANVRPVVAAANAALAHIDLVLAEAVHPLSGVKHFAVVNAAADDPAQLATAFSPAELALVKQIIKAIVTNDDESFSIHSHDALRLASPLKLKASDAERVLDSLVSNSWLTKENSFLSLSLRALMELKAFLRDEFEDFCLNCSVCKEIVTTHYERCSTATCPGRLHKFCAGVYFNAGNARKCPHEGCGAAWEGITPVPSGSSNSVGSIRKKRSVDTNFFGKQKRVRKASGSQQVDDDEEEEEEEDEDLEGFVVADDDDEDEEVPLKKKARNSGMVQEEAKENEDEEEEEEEDRVVAQRKGTKRHRKKVMEVEDEDEEALTSSQKRKGKKRIVQDDDEEEEEDE
ncbi:Non-structural maintenance of chromosomes element 1 [Rhizoclosmatium hyalinum]|nr:Non-structural maintenance of chromosomes element 1 [Rhizoclosmatium hyalinum]